MRAGLTGRGKGTRGGEATGSFSTAGADCREEEGEAARGQRSGRGGDEDRGKEGGAAARRACSSASARVSVLRSGSGAISPTPTATPGPPGEKPPGAASSTRSNRPLRRPLPPPVVRGTAVLRSYLSTRAVTT